MLKGALHDGTDAVETPTHPVIHAVVDEQSVWCGFSANNIIL